MYWIVYSILFSFESSFGFLVNFLPFFQLFRFLFILWLVLPQTQGASQLYLTYVQPFLKEHETEIGDYVWIIYKKSKKLGIEYLTQFLYYVKEYAAHYILNSEVRPYRATEPEVTSKEESLNGGVGKGSLIDTFFAQFKQPPSFIASNNSTKESSLFPSNLFNNTSNDTKSHDSNQGESSLFGTALKIGAAAIQSSLQLPNISKTGKSLSSQATNTRSVSDQTLGVATGASFSKTESLNVNKTIKPTDLSNKDSELGSKSSSTNSLNTEFEFVKPDENSIDSQPLQRNRSGSWFGWRKSSQNYDSQDVVPDKPASDKPVSE